MHHHTKTDHPPLTLDPDNHGIVQLDAAAADEGLQGAIVLDDHVVIDRPVAEVFAHLKDVSGDPEWQTGLIEARFTSPPPVGVGSTGVHVAKPMGRTIEVGWQIVDYVEPRLMAWTFTHGPFTGHEYYSLEPVGSGTRLSHRAVLRPRGLFRLLRPLLSGQFVKQSDEALQVLKGILEAQR